MMPSAAWWRLINAVLLGILISHGICFSENAPNYSFLHEATTAPAVSYYDYIVIGGGTAGCALATTLSLTHTVLLLERGGSPYSNPNITNAEKWIDILIDRAPDSPSQAFISHDGVINNRPRVLGGGSSINAGFYSRAEAGFVRDVGWDNILVQQSYWWAENKVVFWPQVGGWESALIAGMLEAGVTPFNGFTYDHLNGTKVGGTIFDREKRRHTAADLLEYANPRSITVLIGATVHKILFETTGTSRPKATGAVFVDAAGVEHKAFLKAGQKNEIILSAGALGSPQLLMLSGLGPKDHLQSHNIPVVLDQPLIGQGMKDNPSNTVFVPSPIPVDVSLLKLVGITRFGSYIEESSGLNIAGTADPRAYGGYSPRMSGSIVQKVIGPESFGHLELRTLNPSDNPLVTFNYYKDPLDLKRCIAGMQTIVRILESNAFSPYKISSLSAQDILNISAHLPQNFPIHENTSTSLEQFCKDTVKTLWHYHGGCQVGSVVDQEYKVIGVDDLRVVDGSTFIYSPGTNPQATVMMLGRYMGVKILRGRFPK